MRKTTHSSNEQIRVKRASQESEIRATEAKTAAEKKVIDAQANADIRVKKTLHKKLQNFQITQSF